jgi:hypothetical protein
VRALALQPDLPSLGRRAKKERAWK